MERKIYLLVTLLAVSKLGSSAIVKVSCLAELSTLTMKYTTVECPALCPIFNPYVCGTGTYGYGKICQAAIHDGKIINSLGGIVTVVRTPGTQTNIGSVQNGITSSTCLAQTYAYTFMASATATSYYRRPAGGSCALTPLTNNVNNCANVRNYCKNGATCVNGVNSFSCACAPGFSGGNCNINLLDCVKTPCINGGNCTTVGSNSKCMCTGLFSGTNCGTPVSQCYAGVYNSSIVSDSQITASSFYGTGHEPYRGRLNALAVGGSVGAWAVAANKLPNWIQADFLKPMTMYGVLTKARPSAAQRAVTIKVSYGNIPTSMLFIKDAAGVDKVFPANTDQTTIVANHFGKPYTARYWRVYIVTYTGWASTQFEFFTC